MKKNNLVIFALLCLGIGASKAQYTVLHNFAGPDGKVPYGSLSLIGNKLYGLTSGGGANYEGCIFSIDTNGTTYNDMHDFYPATGAFPFGSLTYSSGILFGMTQAGGTGAGTVFSIDTNATGYKDLFNFNNVNGLAPWGSLTILGKKLYGMTNEGGGNSAGNIFSLDTDGSSYKSMYQFSQSDPDYPYGSLTFSGGKLFGMTSMFQAVFSLDTNGSNINVLFFVPGGAPWGDVTIVGKKMYAMTPFGGAYGFGIIFSADTNGRGVKTLISFDGATFPQGATSTGDLIYSSGILYGMTQDGGAHGYGVIFSVDTDGSGYTDLYDFDSIQGRYPRGSLILSGNVLYGMTSRGGTSDSGVVFSFRDNNITTSIKQSSVISAQVSVYPNPSKGIFTFGMKNKEAGIKNIEVFNVLGEQVYSQLSTFNSQLSIDLSSNPSGVYFYRILNETGNLIGEGKLIIQK